MSFWMLLYDYHPGINLWATRLLGWLLGNCWLGEGLVRLRCTGIAG